MKELFYNKRILIIVAHPDDELLGIGGTICRLKSEFNAIVGVVILGEGITSRADTRDVKKWKSELELHRSNIYDAKQILGYDDLSLHAFPDNRFDSVALLDIVKILEEEVTTFKPDVIFTHHETDLNIDHQYTFNAVITATRPLEDKPGISIFTFETPSSTEWQLGKLNNRFQPNFFIEIDEIELKKKTDAMECYMYERRDYPHPRSTEALLTLAKLRGFQNGKKLAEAFMMIRTLI